MDISTDTEFSEVLPVFLWDCKYAHLTSKSTLILIDLWTYRVVQTEIWPRWGSACSIRAGTLSSTDQKRCVLSCLRTNVRAHLYISFFLSLYFQFTPLTFKNTPNRPCNVINSFSTVLVDNLLHPYHTSFPSPPSSLPFFSPISSHSTFLSLLFFFFFFFFSIGYDCSGENVQ